MVTKKDLVYWIIILIIILVHKATTDSLENLQLINYIGFSGTLVSIILALVAIIYSFYQSYQNTTITTNLTKLNGKLKGSVYSLREIADEIKLNTENVYKKIEVGFRSTQSEIKKQLKNFADSPEMRKALIEETKHSEDLILGKEKTLEIIKRVPILEKNIYTLYLLAKTQKKLSISQTLSRKSNDPKEMPKGLEQLAGIFEGVEAGQFFFGIGISNALGIASVEINTSSPEEFLQVIKLHKVVTEYFESMTKSEHSEVDEWIKTL
ncbi:hypothetical protein [Leptospira licerasiae]|uniref:hypothetical protein n=1 Tax=Leptospira licerasiae TaxID=447106 RepID=UPI001083B4F7|nr:hypothetical protein [Leptospira licerasiae]TGM88715.1 hypothetical protein EHR05_12495 [Leptospira licerasiae]